LRSSAQSTSDPWPEDILPKEEWKEFIGAGDSATPETFDSPSALIVKLFSHVVEEHEVKGGVQWLRHLHELDKDFKDVASVERAFTAFYPMLSSDSAAKVLKDVLGGDFHKELTRMQEYLLERGLGGVGESPKIVLNGIVMSVPSTDMLQQLLVRGLSNEQTVAAEMVQRKQINDKSNFAKAFEKRPDVVSRLGSNVVQTLEKMVVMNALPAVPKLHYMHGQGEVREFGIKAATVWCVVDLGSAKGLRLAMAAVEQLYSPGTRNADPSVNSRLAIIHNPVNGLSGGAKLAAFLNTLASRVSSTKALPVMRQALALVSRLDPNAQNDIALLRVLNLSSLSEKVKAAIAKAVVEAVTETAGSAAKFEVAAGDSVLILNGRVLTFGPETTLAGARADLDTLIESFYASMRGRELVDLLSQTSFDEMDPDAVTAQWVDDVALRLSFTLLQEAKAGSAGGAPMPVVSEDEAMVRHRVEKPGVRVWAVLNPLSQDAQKLAPFLVMLRDAFEADVTVVLNPHKTVAEFPLKRFYRYAVTSSLTFDTLGAVRPAPGVVFRDLVTQSLLTLTMDMPESWRVAAESCPYDLDNIRLSEIKQDALTAVFRLKNLLISGQCYEEGGQPPAGLQLDLGRGSEVMADTLVMANLGYFQLQANPGAWKLSLHGAANTVYSIDGGSLAQGDKHESRRLFVKAFDEGLRMLDVIRRPGQEVTKLEDLTMVQAPAASKGGFLSSLWNGGASKEVVSASTDETVHIFSVASGHLYERFLKIMMLSVVKNTKSPVKFWFIENFFSPQFKDFAPKMAEKYGYEIEFVTYKWPAWLRRQTEKQRVIWGYKVIIALFKTGL
jgi:UDP-glucose:glycoprotein glucosyltransferase